MQQTILCMKQPMYIVYICMYVNACTHTDGCCMHTAFADPQTPASVQVMVYLVVQVTLAAELYSVSLLMVDAMGIRML